jgi:RyR domain
VLQEALARAIHEDYVRRELEKGRSPETNPSMVGWDALPPTLKESNRDQAAHIEAKLAAIGCAIDPTGPSGEDQFAFTPREIERLARMEHDRWWKERTAAGWVLGPQKDVDRRTSPDLVPWEDLSESVRDYDRETVRAIPEFLARVGYSIIRIS